MRALISGQAGLAMVFDSDGVWSTSVESPTERLPCAQTDALHLFAYADDVTELVDVTPSQVTSQLENAWRFDRALQLTLILLDHEDDQETRGMAAECVEEHFGYDGVEEFIANRLYSAPLPTAADMLGAKLYAEQAAAHRVATFLQSLETAQAIIARLRKSWNELGDELFRDPDDRRMAENAFVAAGWFRRFAQGAVAGGVEAELMQCLQDERIHAVPQYRRVVTELASPLKSKPKHDEKEIEDDFEENEADERADKSSRKGPRRRRPRKVRNEPSIHDKWKRAEQEQESIVTLVDQGRVEQALKYTDELVQRQVKEENSDFAAKTLCNLAQQMKHRRRFDLQLRWSERAVEVLPADPQTHNQMADAYFRSGEKDQALRLYEETMKQFPRNEVAHCGRAEVLRELGRLDEALRLYEKTMQQFPLSEVAHCGRAEVLRELGRLDEALRLYEETMKQFPRDEVARNGRAEVLRELGRLDEALRLYEETMQQFPRNEVARNGRAEVLRELGRLDDALRLYEETIQQFPRDEVARCGRAEVLRELGRLDEALRLYEETMQQFPRNEVARNGLVGVLMEIERFEEALALLPQKAPTTKNDWISFHIRGMIHLRRGDFSNAADIFKLGLRECPIASSRPYFQNAFGLALLRQGRFKDVQSTLQGVKSETADVLRLHAYGEQGELDKAEATYNRLLTSQRDRIKKLRDELAPVYVSGEQVQRRESAAWRDEIYRQECQLVLRTAA